MLNNQLITKLLGMHDARSRQGIYSRGANVYNGTSMAARTGSAPNIGRPPKSAVLRRLQRGNRGV